MGLTLVGVWFLLSGLGHFVAIPQLGLVLSVLLALVAGLLLLVGR